MDNIQSGKITLRRAADFGTQLALDLAEKLHNEQVEPYNWPEKFPITTRKIAKLPEINQNSKVAKRANEAAQAIWQEIRDEAIAIENFLRANPELHNSGGPEDWAWRRLSMEIEKTAGNIFLTDYMSEDVARNNIYNMLKPYRLRRFMLEFEDDYKSFIDEIRENIREQSGLLASLKLELICLLNVNTQLAHKLQIKTRKKSR